MAGKLPLNSESAEMVLPPDDIFLTVALSSKDHHHDHNPRRHRPISCMDGLATHVAALSFLHNSHTAANRLPPKPAPRSHLPAIRPAGQLPSRLVGLNGGRPGDIGQRSLPGYGSNRPTLHPPDPVGIQQQVLDSYDTRARILQNQQQQVLPQKWPVYPIHGYGLGFGFAGGFGRESGGTGVFIPRVVNSSRTRSAAANHNNYIVTSNQAAGGRSRENITQVTGQGSLTSNADLDQQEDCHYHLPPEIVLPQEWTY